MTFMGRQLVTIFGVGLAIMLIAKPAGADTGRPDGARLILVQNQNELSEEELKRLLRKEKRKLRQEQRQDAERAKRQEHRERQRVNQEDHRKLLRERREAEKAKRQEHRERQRANQEERRKLLRERREAEKAERRERREHAEEEEERRKRLRERRESKKAEREERARELRERQRAEREERRKKALERRRNELADEQDERKERARRYIKRTQEEREEARERLLEQAEDDENSAAIRAERRKARRKFTREKLKDIKRERHERREAGGRVVIEEPGKRRIIRESGRVVIENDDDERLRGAGREVEVIEGPGGRTRTIITRPNGTQIITVRNRDGTVIRRVKRLRNGRKIVLFNNELQRKRRARRKRHDALHVFIDLPDLVYDSRRHDYYVYADRADEHEIEDILTADPIERFEEDYTLDEIRYSPDIRARLRKLNVNTVTFDFGSWEIREDQYYKLEVVARVIKRIIERDESEVFLLGGHTDAVGSEEDNLSLSDRRAETVARILTDEFGVPPENLVTQGYGESDLLVDTQSAEAANRRVEFMRITPALAQYDNE